MKRAIEEDFPIVEINRLAVPERNGFKPVYQMHKSFAPRASCVFRAILLATHKPAGTDIMREFYRDHTNDPDTLGKTVLDPFMGGGTTIVEAVRLGMRPIGIELNPVPWFVVKMALASADISDLDKAYERLEKRHVAWSGRPLSETLNSLYQTSAPFHLEGAVTDAHIFHTYWVKSAICTNRTCGKTVPLFSDYIVSKKAPSIRFQPDCTCPNCGKNFDWEIEPAAMVADPKQMIHSSTYSAGIGRSTTRWTYSHPKGGLYVCQGQGSGGQSSVQTGTLEAAHACCPHCSQIVRPNLNGLKPKRKKVPLAVLHCPHTEEVFQWRGELSTDTQVTSPLGHNFFPMKGNVPDDGGFLCSHCGNRDSVINAIRALPDNQLLPMHVYAVQAYCKEADLREKEEEDQENDLFNPSKSKACTTVLSPNKNLIWKNKGKFFARFGSPDLAKYQHTEAIWEQYKESLSWPRSKVPNGEKTKSGLHSHNYMFWSQMFCVRQLLALSTLLAAIREESDEACRELLLLAFSGAVERNNLFCRYFNDRNTIQGSFDRHDFAPKIDPAENCVWGPTEIRGTFQNMIGRVLDGVEFRKKIWDRDINRLGEKDSLIFSSEIIAAGRATLHNGDSREIIPQIEGKVDAIVTDPPYAGNVNYSELYDFFYVWLRLALKDRYDAFQPEYTPKSPEIVENKSRGLSNSDFREGLKTVFERGREKLKDDGLLVFTYHHSGNQQWVDLCDAVCLAGFTIEAVYPVHGDKESSLNLQNTEGISYDLVHVCRKRPAGEETARRSWAGLRSIIRQRAREEIERIEAGRYGMRALASGDVRMVLIGKCLEIYSQHFGSVLDWKGNPLPMREALLDIGDMVEQMLSKENPLPAELENIDVISRVWLRGLCTTREVTNDSVRKLIVGIFELSDLTSYKPPLLRKGRVKGGRTFEVLTPLERLEGLRVSLREPSFSSEQLGLFSDAGEIGTDGPNLVDVLHFLIANAEQGERLDQLVERFRGQREPLRAALEYLQQRDPNRWGKACEKLLPFYSDTMLAKYFTPTT